MQQGTIDSLERFGGILEVEDGFAGDKGYAQGPERGLLSAILFDAIQIILKDPEISSGGRSPVHEALSWVMTRDSDYVFSFENVCEGLGIEPDAFRLGIINAVNTRRQRNLRRWRCA